MRLADRIARCKAPFIVQRTLDGTVSRLTGASAFARKIEQCPLRYVMSDDLTRLCTALAYSKGATSLSCADLLHVPAERVWIEWTEAPWRRELDLYGFGHPTDSPAVGRRGVFIESTPQGRGGVLRTFWTNGDGEDDVLMSSMEAHFDLDAGFDADRTLGCKPRQPSVRVIDGAGSAKLLGRCFRFAFERSWCDYYDSARLTPAQLSAVLEHALGTIAIDIPVVLAFCLLLATRPGLSQRPLMVERINRTRMKDGKAPLLEQLEVCAPLLPDRRPLGSEPAGSARRGSRLHHVRGHLVRRGDRIFWRVPHLRGNARLGASRTRTVTWVIDASERDAAAHVSPTLR